MRKVTQDAVEAFHNNRNFRSKNTEVVANFDGSVNYLLHGNRIAYKSCVGDVFVSNCGWLTPTTKERLNGLSGVNINQSDFVWYLNGQEMPTNQFVQVS